MDRSPTKEQIMTLAPQLTEDRAGAQPLRLVDVPQEAEVDPTAVPACFRNDVGLSDREAMIVRLVAQGRSNDEISRTVWLSLNTIKSYLRSAYRRMAVESRTQAVVWAFDHALVSPAAAPVAPPPRQR